MHHEPENYDILNQRLPLKTATIIATTQKPENSPRKSPIGPKAI